MYSASHTDFKQLNFERASPAFCIYDISSNPLYFVSVSKHSIFDLTLAWNAKFYRTFFSEGYVYT